jgi:hypothetical protein
MKDAECTIEFHIRYLQALRMCQVTGTKLGHFDHGPYKQSATYVLDGKVWQFNCGVILGPVSYTDWLEENPWQARRKLKRIRRTKLRVAGLRRK